MVYLLKMVIFHGKLLVITRWYMFLPSVCGDSYGAFSQQSNELRIGNTQFTNGESQHSSASPCEWHPIRKRRVYESGGHKNSPRVSQNQHWSSIIRQSVSINGVIRGWVPFRNLRTPLPRIPSFSCVVQAPCGSCGRPQPWSFSGSRAFVVTCTLAAKSRGPWRAWSCSFGAIGMVIMHILIHTNTY